MVRKIKEENMIDFTPENLENLKVAKWNTEYVRSKEQPYLGAQRQKLGGPVKFYFISGTMMRNGAALQGIKLHYRHIIGTDLEAAKIEAKRLYALYFPMQVKRGRGQTYINIQNGAPVDGSALFKDRGTKADPIYDVLMSVLMDAYSQAAYGKGKDRHANGHDFMDQDMISITDMLGVNGPLFQAVKKISEGRRLKPKKARDEFLGAIVYIAGAIAWMDKQAAEMTDPVSPTE